MSFQFGFTDSEELELEAGEGVSVLTSEHRDERARPADKPSALADREEPARELSLDALLKTLPPALSYSPIFISIDAHSTEGPDALGPHRLALARRDLFDARFQMLHHDADGANNTTSSSQGSQQMLESQIDSLEISEASQTSASTVGADSDLVPGVYEGGLKTWECASDLIAELHKRTQDGQLILPGTKIIELGCGTALPSMYVLSQLLSNGTAQSGTGTTLDLADFNAQVLRLVTLPNLILTWYFSPASKAFRGQAEQRSSQQSESEEGKDASPEVPGDLELSPELLAAFQQSLREHRVQLRFFSGSWSRLSALLFPSSTTDSADHRQYGLILTSETVYSLQTLPSLVNILHDCSTGPNPAGGDSRGDEDGSQAVCLVAAKVLYFGVGGGVHSFIQAVQAHESRSGSVRQVRQINSGVGRAVLSVHWSKPK